MRGCKKSKDGHSLHAVKDPEVKEQTCGLSEVWSPDGVKELWLCCHHLRCRLCKRVVSELVLCPDKRDPTVPQDRRWR